MEILISPPAVYRTWLTDLENLKKVTEDTLNVKIDTKTSARPNVDARRVFTLLAFKKYNSKLHQIAILLSRDHAMAIHYRNTGSDLLKTDKAFRTKYSRVESNLLKCEYINS